MKAIENNPFYGLISFVQVITNLLISLLAVGTMIACLKQWVGWGAYILWILVWPFFSPTVLFLPWFDAWVSGGEVSLGYLYIWITWIVLILIKLVFLLIFDVPRTMSPSVPKEIPPVSYPWENISNKISNTPVKLSPSVSILLVLFCGLTVFFAFNGPSYTGNKYGDEYPITLAGESDEGYPEEAETLKDNFKIIPGERVGPIVASTTLDDLIQWYGTDNVTYEEVAIGEGVKKPATKLSHGSGTLEIVWKDSENMRFPETVRLSGISSQWATPEGLSLNSTLKDIEKMNGKAFSIFGFGWDYGGWLLSWEGGQLKTPNGYLLVKFENVNANGLPPSRITAIQGNKIVHSSNTILQQANPKITEIIVAFDKISPAFATSISTLKNKSCVSNPTTPQETLFCAQNKYQNNLTAYAQGVKTLIIASESPAERERLANNASRFVNEAGESCDLYASKVFSLLNNNNTPEETNRLNCISEILQKKIKEPLNRRV